MKTKDEGLHFRQHYDEAMEKFLTNYKGPPSKKCKTDEEVRQRKQNMIDLFVYENFSLTGLQCLNG